MSLRIDRVTLLTLVEGDTRLIEKLVEAGFLVELEEGCTPEEAERARVATTLQELDVNWPGIEIILRMREQILDTQRQMGELCRLLRESLPGGR